MIIGVTDTVVNPVALERYRSWVTRWFPDADLPVLSYTRDNAGHIDRCHGLLLTGGGDVDPRLYGRADALSITSEVDERRDAFELGLIDIALKRCMPILAICRGMQLFNVSRGGSLVPDVEQAGFPSHRKSESGDRRHDVEVEAGSRLGAIVGASRGNVNSAHHQAVDRVGDGLLVAARSPEGVVEALEYGDPRNTAAVLLIQWHPERMPDAENPFARNIINTFAQHIERFITTEEHA
jgi:putative glutamine amidotransferase